MSGFNFQRKIIHHLSDKEVTAITLTPCVSWPVKQTLVLLPNCTREICLGPWTVCMRGMDLEPCTRDGCKNWPAQDLVPPNKFLSWVSWFVKQRLVFQTVEEKKFVLAFGLSACVEWILNFVQETGVRTDLQRSWFHPTNSLPKFLGRWNKDWSSKL